MRILTGKENELATKYMKSAAEIAKASPCYRSKCGSIIVKDEKIIGRGFNSPPNGKTLEKCLKDDLPKNFKSDKTCCVHAEQRAIMDALTEHQEYIMGSRLYFIRLDNKGEIAFAGKPYCTICSKMALDSGVGEFVLWHKEGITVYDAAEYNNLSFAYREDGLFNLLRLNLFRFFR